MVKPLTYISLSCGKT